jgi:hypothetical protein
MEVASVIERSYYTIMKLSDPGRQEPPWIVHKVIHATGVTLLYGEAKGGKSTLAAALAATLANGQGEFLGRKVIAPTKSIGILAGDTGDAGRYHEQLREVSSSDGITLYDVKRPPVRQLWEDIRVDVRTAGHDLLIVDNLTTLIPGSMNDDVAVNLFYDVLDSFVRDGTIVVLIAHTSEKFGEHGKSKFPMGSSAIRARARWLCRVERRANSTLLAFHGNEDSPHEIIASRANGHAHFDVIGTATAEEIDERSHARQRATLDKNAAIARYVATLDDGLTGVAKAEKIAAEFGGSEFTHRSKLSRGVYKLAGA